MSTATPRGKNSPQQSRSAVTIRRTRREPFIPPKDTEDLVVSRELLSIGRIDKPQLSRNRKIAGDLPDWDPLPPGELTIVRPTGAHAR